MRPLLAIVALAGVLAAEEIPRAVPLLDGEALPPQDEARPVEWVAPTGNAPDLPERVLSGSRQFGVSGGDAAQRGSVAIQADAIRRDFYRLLDLGELEPAFPIEILLHGRPGDPPRKRPIAHELRFTRDAFLLRIHIDLSRGIDHERLERAVLSGLIYEEALRDEKPGPRDVPLRAPVWLIEGLREAQKWRAGHGDRALYEGVFKQQGWFTLEQLFAMKEQAFDELDGASRMAFRVLSGAMAMALLEQQPQSLREDDEGPKAFAAFCRKVAVFEGDMPILLREHFPELNLSERSLAKWWALTLAKLADAPLTEVLGIFETEETLADALMIPVRDERGSIRELPFSGADTLGSIPVADRPMAIRPAQDALNRLSYRCFPSYRSLLLDYQRLLTRWARGEKEEELAVELAELEETRLLMKQRAVEARDYLDWVEIRGASEASGSFEDYKELIHQLGERPRVPKSDPVSGYLDTFERIYAPSER